MLISLRWYPIRIILSAHPSDRLFTLLADVRLRVFDNRLSSAFSKRHDNVFTFFSEIFYRLCHPWNTCFKRESSSEVLTQIDKKLSIRIKAHSVVLIAQLGKEWNAKTLAQSVNFESSEWYLWLKEAGFFEFLSWISQFPNFILFHITLHVSSLQSPWCHFISH